MPCNCSQGTLKTVVAESHGAAEACATSDKACGRRGVHWHSLSAVFGTLMRRGRAEPESAEFRRVWSGVQSDMCFGVPMKREIMALVSLG